MDQICSSAEVLTWLGKAGSATAAEVALVNMLLPMSEDAIRTYLGYTVTQGTYTHFLPDEDEATEGPMKLDVVNNRVSMEFEGGVGDLWLPERPVRSITSVYEDRASNGGQGVGDFAAETLLTAGTDYFLDYTTSGASWSGLLRKCYGAWSPKRRSVKVTYVAGMTGAELDAGSVRGPSGSTVRQIKYAAIITCAHAFVEAIQHQSSTGTSGVGGIKSERLADYAVQYADESARQFSMLVSVPQKACLLLSNFRRLSV